MSMFRLLLIPLLLKLVLSLMIKRNQMLGIMLWVTPMTLSVASSKLLSLALVPFSLVLYLVHLIRTIDLSFFVRARAARACTEFDEVSMKSKEQYRRHSCRRAPRLPA